MSRNNIVLHKSKDFAVRIVKLRKYLRYEQKEFDISAQIVRSGTSIGANIREAVIGFSKPDFVFKMNIALKEACETEYWLEILHETGYLSDSEFRSIYSDCNELARLLTTIVKSSKNEQDE